MQQTVKDEWLEYLVTIAILLTLICVARIGLDYAGFFAWLRGPASTVLNNERAGEKEKTPALPHRPATAPTSGKRSGKGAPGFHQNS